MASNLPNLSGLEPATYQVPIKGRTLQTKQRYNTLPVQKGAYTNYQNLAPSRQRYWALVAVGSLTAALAITWIALLINDLVFAFTYDPVADGGSVELTADISALGFGVARRLMVIDITEMGGHGNMHRNDKQHATLRVWGQKADPADGDFTGEEYHIGIEYKGGGLDERTKPNYGIEIWEGDGTDAAGNIIWDDDKEKLFFSEKMEDFVLRGGFYEPTLTRDPMAPRLAGAPYETTLTEVVFKQGDRHTYEGVYMLQQDIGRRQLEKNIGWADDGKKKDCVDITPNTTEGYQAYIDKVALVFEYDVVSERKKADDTCSGALHVISDYPKCKFLDEQAATPYTGCAALYQAEHDRFAAMLALGPNDAVPSEVDASLPALARMFMSEQFMLDQGFGADSEFFYVAPRVGNATRSIGAVSYDHDETHWRLLDSAAIGISLVDFWNVNDEVTGKPLRHMPLWNRLATYEPFLAELRANGATWMTEMLAVMEDVFATRIAELEAGYWDRNNERWPLAGRLALPRINHQMFTVFMSDDAIPKSSMAEELTYARDWLRTRGNRVSGLLPTLSAIPLEETEDTLGAVAAVVRRLTPFITISTLLLVSVIGLLWVWMWKK